MSRRIGVAAYWMREEHPERLVEKVQVADASGIDSVWLSEGWGHDLFTLMTRLVLATSNIQIGSSIVNVFSRSPGVLAQHFATLDELSGGRMMIGLGTSGPAVVERFHGVPFHKPLRRLREYVEIINLLMAGGPYDYAGEIFRIEGGLPLSFEPPRKHIPIYLATLSPASIRQTAAIADGWLPLWTPIEDLSRLIDEFRQLAVDAGRSPREVMVRAPGTIIITKEVEQTRAMVAASFAFYVARMGEFYYRHISRLGHPELADGIRESYAAGGRKAGARAVPGSVQQSLGLVTQSVEEARDRIAEEAEAGVDLHSVEVRGQSSSEMGRTFEELQR